jgi:hypothetical protein
MICSLVQLGIKCLLLQLSQVKEKKNWGLIYASDCTSEFTYPGSTTPNLGSGTSTSALLQQAHSSAVLSSLDTELSSYLDSDLLQKFDEDFNILNWWHEHKLSYPVLSILARDVILFLFQLYLQNMHLVSVAG